MSGTIKHYIWQRMLNRMNQTGILVVYDSDVRYRDMCLEMSNNELTVIDASVSSIESREAALRTLRELGSDTSSVKRMIIFVPAKASLTDEDKQKDPFSVYAACGSIFPDPREDGDSYESLCISAKPDQVTAIRKIFLEDSNPPFAVIDAVGTGQQWPVLQTLLDAGSAREILFSLLVPTEMKLQQLNESDSWLAEAKQLLGATLGMHVEPGIANWKSLADRLWRYLLFSEFVFDAENPLPSQFSGVQRAPNEARQIIESLCDRLRSDRNTQPIYVERAESVEQELELASLCSGMSGFGVRNTFPFEERYLFQQAISLLIHGENDRVREILRQRIDSVWTSRGESEALWTVLQSALLLTEACDDAMQVFSDYQNSLNHLFDYYTGYLREVDRLHREFEHAVSIQLDTDDSLSNVIDMARSHYDRIMIHVQGYFIKHLETTGWPIEGRMSNADLFDKIVAPKLQISGRRVALFLVDALRYELGVALEKQLQSEGQTELIASCAQLPTVTVMGMASLLPEAGKLLSVRKTIKGEWLPHLGDIPLSNVNQRMDILRKRYGERFTEMPLKRYLKSKTKLSEQVELLVLRTDAIDAAMETDMETALGQIQDTMKRIRNAITMLQKADFHEVIIATDHGFVLNAVSGIGDNCPKPPGDWVVLHERSLLGRGIADSRNFVVSSEAVGIRGDYEHLGGPRGLASYRTGMNYFHGGVSMQETILPVVSLRFRQKDPDHRKPTVMLTYKNGSRRVTTRLPVVTITLEYYDLLMSDTSFEVLLEAHDQKGQIVGEAKTGGAVNPTTGTIQIISGESMSVTIKMHPDFEGAFVLKALNPKTMVAYSELELETDYVV